MLKVLKYDWKHGWNSIRSMLLGAAIVSAAAGFIFRVAEKDAVMMVAVWFAVMVALLVLTVNAIFRNMSGRMFGPEGYLTHTLPVSNRELLLGKAVGTWLFGVFMVFAAIACWILLLVCDAGLSAIGGALSLAVEALPKLGVYHFRQLAVGLGYAALGLLSFLAVSFLLVVQFQFVCIAARQFGKYHIAGGVIVFVVLMFLEGTWNQSFSWGFLTIVLFSALCYAGSSWLLKHRLSI